MENWEVLYRLKDGSEGSFVVPAINRLMVYDQIDDMFADMEIDKKNVMDISISLNSMESLGYYTFGGDFYE